MTSGQSWDVVVVGGRLVGSSEAYRPAVAGLRTLLIERGDLASDASGANFGLVQVRDAEFGPSLKLTMQRFSEFSPSRTLTKRRNDERTARGLD